MKVHRGPTIEEAEMCRLVAAGAEVEITCVQAPDLDARNRGEWHVTVWHDGEALALFGYRAERRTFVRFEGICAYCAHTLQLAEVRVPFIDGATTRGMFHRAHAVAENGNDQADRMSREQVENP